MVVAWANDGQIYNKEEITSYGFQLNEQRDISRIGGVLNELTAEGTASAEKEAEEIPLKEVMEEEGAGGRDVYCFVGFLVNDENDTMAVFPKHFRVQDAEQDARTLFGVIAGHAQQHPEIYLGERYGKEFQTNYPFAAFFGIYDYYRKYGIMMEDVYFVKPNAGGRVNWKETIRRAGVYLSGGAVSLFPLYYNQKYYFSNFLTECMIFAIDYTLEKFGTFVGLPKTGQKFPEMDFLGEREAVLENLARMRQQVFRDNLLELIDHLYAFFSGLKEGGAYYFKHYAFSSVWEDMVMDYLKENFREVKGNSPVFDRAGAKHLAFKKVSFYPNLSDSRQYFSPDYYFTEGDTQFIFDAKYYTAMRGMDYKQIAYYLFLCELRDKETDADPKYRKTCSALLLPGEKRESRIHFQMNPRFNKTNAELIIMEEYLDIREVMEFYLGR